MAKPSTQDNDRARALRRKRARFRSRLVRIHRWVGLIAAFILVVVSVTGVALNHTSSLGLDTRYVGQDWLLDYYGIDRPEPPTNFAVDGNWLSVLESNLYWNGEPLDTRLNQTIGAVGFGEMIIVASPSELVLLDLDGALIERMGSAFLPGSVTRIGVQPDHGAVIATKDGLFGSDEELVEWVPIAPANIPWSSEQNAPVDLVSTVVRSFRQSLLTWERVMLDLHSGRLAGINGPLLWDIAAVALIFLAGTGIYNAVRR